MQRSAHACRDCRPLLEREEGGSKGLGASQELNGTQLGRPARLEEEGGGEGSAAAEARWPLGCTAALLAWPCTRARPSRFPEPGEPAGERGKAGPCVPRAALEGAPAAG